VLQRLVQELEAAYRDAVIRVDLDGRSHRQAAEELCERLTWGFARH
jgi:DNA-directed RNA polymerase specialized sigma24 family protein